jgi:hypothetical protein
MKFIERLITVYISMIAGTAIASTIMNKPVPWFIYPAVLVAATIYTLIVKKKAKVIQMYCE